MRYPLFLSDFDGTIARSDGTVSRRTKEAIAKYRAAGGKFVVCSGRMLPSVLPRARELGIVEGPVVAYQGATIADIATGELLKDDGFSFEDGLLVLRALERRKEHIHFYTVDTLYSLHAYERICGVKGEIEPDLSAFAKEERRRAVKILAMVPPERNAPLRASLREELGERFYVTSSSEFLVEVMPAGQSKASAVDFLAAYYSVPREKTAAIGDQLNDLPMIERAGGGFAVGNAVGELKKKACVVPSNDDDGVAYALENYAMGEEK